MIIKFKTTQLKDTLEIEADVPHFPDCFQQTLLVWFPCGYLWIALPFYTIYTVQKKFGPPLPFSALNITKTILCICLVCITLCDQLVEEHDGYQCQGREIPTSHYVATGVKVVTYLLAVIVLQIQRLKGEISSGVLFLFWMFQIFCAVIPFQSKITNQAGCMESIVYYVYFILLCVEFLLHCFKEKYKPSGIKPLKQPCPERHSSVLSQFTFWWLTSLVVTAYRKTLGPDDIWDQTPKLKSQIVGPELEAAWKNEKKLCQNRDTTITYKSYSREITYNNEKTPLLLSGSNLHSDVMLDRKSRSQAGRKPSLYKALFKTYIRTWLQVVAYRILADCLWLVQPFIIRQIIALIEEKATGRHPVWQGYALTACLLISGISAILFFNRIYYNVMVLGLRVKTALINLIYRKSLTMTHASKKLTAVGDIVSLMSVDCQRIQDSFTYSYYIISFPDLVILGMLQLFDLMGVAALGSFAVILVLIPSMVILGGLQQKQHREILNLKGKRINLLNEIIGGIKVLKMYAWEKSFEDKVQALRSGELKRLHKLAGLNALHMLCSIHSPFLMMYFTILIYVLMSPDHFIDAQKVFTALSLVNILWYTVSVFPFLINGLIQGYVSVGRIQNFLWNEDLDPSTIEHVSKSDYAVEMENGVFTWDRHSHKATLQEINLKIKEGQLIAVVGKVGAGKSSVISALLGEIEKVQGRVTIKGSLAYVPQEAWIQNLTLRDNILYAKDFSEKKYHRVLEACALLSDLEILDGGDMTEIGEKGINISGGQKQRVSLARAVYSNADVYLMDDPLSAVDSHVGKDLFKNVIGNNGLLRHKTRILVTHGVHWLPMVDRVIVMVDGRISEVGSFDELLSHNGAFAQFLQEYLVQEKSSDEEDPEIEQIKDEMWQKVEYVTSEGLTSDDNQETTTVRRRRRLRRTSGRDNVTRSNSRETVSQSIQLTKEPSHFSRLIEEETAQIGAVNIGVFIAFAKAMGFIAIVLVYIFMGAFQGLNIFSNYWLTFWTEDPYLKNRTLSNTTLYNDKFVKYLVVYTVMGITQGVFLFLFAYIGLNSMVRASGYLHNSMLAKILRSPMSFFDTTPIGRIMNRFSSDIDIMDINLPLTFRLWMVMTFNLLSTILVVSVNTPIFLAAIVPVGVVYILMLVDQRSPGNSGNTSDIFCVCLCHNLSRS